MAEMKTWQVGPYHDDWVVIVHAKTRGEAKYKGMGIGFDEFIDMRAIRLPSLDGQLITTQALIAAGFPEEYEGQPINAHDYLLACGCDVCAESLRLLNAVAS